MKEKSQSSIYVLLSLQFFLSIESNNNKIVNTIPFFTQLYIHYKLVIMRKLIEHNLVADIIYIHAAREHKNCGLVVTLV